MKKQFVAIALALLLPIGTAMAATVYVSGSGTSYDPRSRPRNAALDRKSVV